MAPISIIILGAGGRGYQYSTYAKAYPELAKVVAVAEPRVEFRNRMALEHQITPENAVDDWRKLLDRPKFAEVAIIATQDKMHVDPAVACADKGYHILLEKPMAPTEADCRRIVNRVLQSPKIFAVCHNMRYTRYTRKVKEVVTRGVIGDVVNIQSLEPVGYWHQAHSFVRGNWRNEKESSPMLLAKSCHDLDWIRYIMGVSCLAAHSFGALKHFRKEEKPAGAGNRCLECGIEPLCPYSAKRLYLGGLSRGVTTWPVNVLTLDVTESGITQALQQGPYGRCVYDCDNDVVDNQVVNLMFEGNRTASFTMTAFTDIAPRQVRIFGTMGMLVGDGIKLRHFDFLTDTWKEIVPDEAQHSVLQGHDGGDFELMKSFISAVTKNDPNLILSGPKETLETHLMVFAAEQARRENKVVTINIAD
ncbi:MAG: Gfo/Idh/MocA family protein [bacterium]